MNEGEKILCPAHRCKIGSQLLGVRQNDGTIAILPQTFIIDDAFIEKTKQHSISPERRFRFTNKCIEGGCKQWNGKGCSVAEKVTKYLDAIPFSSKLPNCPIRDKCRWYVQKGRDACRICTYIHTENIQKELKVTANNH